ncbi:MAG: FAD-dependent oxidoreductase [Actinobacteria bacterium]|nr:FAD-dependent oxidoreductase [Actinomycetota bacterium]
MITVIGGGPAGMRAALTAANSGARVLLLESGPRLGGQYWRHLPEEGAEAWTGQTALQSDYLAGFLLRNQVLSNPKIESVCDAQIWSTTKNDASITVNFLHDGISHSFETQILILATGAFDRTLPFPGWDIPGVMTPGGAQALLKGSNVHAGKKIVVAGTGPFLLPVASGLAKAGADIVGLYEAQRLRKWISYSGVAILNLRKIAQGANYLRQLRQGRGFAVISAHAGEDGLLKYVRVAKIDTHFRIKKGSETNIQCDAAAIGWGFTPNLSIVASLGLQQIPGQDGFPVVAVDELQRTSDPRIFAAGEITGVGGAELSLSEGMIAGQSAADFLGKVSRSATLSKNKSISRRRSRQRKFANTLMRIYSVQDGWRTWLGDDTNICRCEEVSLQTLKASIHELGVTNIRSAKLLTRVGMGACQGRICSRSAVEIIAAEQKLKATVEEHISAGNRPIFSPITLGQLAQQPIAYDAL